MSDGLDVPMIELKAIGGPEPLRERGEREIPESYRHHEERGQSLGDSVEGELKLPPLPGGLVGVLAREEEDNGTLPKS